MSNLIPLGFYDGLPTTLHHDLSVMTQALGRAPIITNLTIDPTHNWSQWAESANYATRNLLASHTNLIPQVSLPMASWWEHDTAASIFPRIAAGQKDAELRAIFHELKPLPQGFLRIGWEQNGFWFAWSVRSAADAAGYRAAFQHIVTLARHDLPGWKMEWSPNATVVNGPVDTRASYPGDAYVDVVAATAYSNGFPYSKGHWIESQPTGWDVPKTIAFAKAHHKLFALSEAGAGGPAGGPSPRDDPSFPNWIAGQLHGVRTAYVSIWDKGYYKFTDGSRPLEAAAWRHLAQTAREPAGYSVTVTHGRVG